MSESSTQPLPSPTHNHPDLFPIFHPPSTLLPLPLLPPPHTLHPSTQDTHSSHNTLHITNEFAGDLLTSRDKDTTRLVFGNVNGLQFNDHGHRWDSICKDIQAMEADLIGLAETNIDDTKFDVKQILHSVLRKHFQHYSVASSSSSIPAASRFKPGGTLNLFHDDLVGRISSKGSDHLGRWSYHKLIGQSSKIITIVTAYQVCKRTTTAVTPDEGMTAYVQQERMLREEGHANINPRKHFCKDLTSFLKQLRANNESVILCGDFNDVLDMNSPLIQLCTDPALQMVDILSTLHPTTCELPTCDRGSTRINFALISPDLVPTIRSCGYLPFRLYINSDHRFLFLDFSTSVLFGDPSKLASVPTRDIRSKDPKAVTTYLEAKH
jgi:exonuclease III